MNPFVEMDKYTRGELKAMSTKELLEVQRSVLYPHERKLFDAHKQVILKPGDGRGEFLDFTDKLICKLFQGG